MTFPSSLPVVNSAYQYKGAGNYKYAANLLYSDARNYNVIVVMCELHTLHPTKPAAFLVLFTVRRTFCQRPFFLWERVGRCTALVSRLCFSNSRTAR